MLLAWIVAMVVATWVVPCGALLVAAGSLATRLRTDRKKQIAVWTIAIVLTVISLFPFVVAAMGWSWTSVTVGKTTVG